MEDKGVGIVHTRGVELQWVPRKVTGHGELWGWSGLLGLSYHKARGPGLYTITTPVLGYQAASKEEEGTWVKSLSDTEGNSWS